jgi:CheY-like chemotaxis protein
MSKENTNRDITKIILVEDDESHTVLIKKMLKRGGLTNEIICFDNGMEFLKFLNNYDKEPSDMIVLLDLNLPLLDGYQVLERVRTIYPKTTLPVVVISTTARGSEIELSYSKGCNTFLKKPVSFLDLMESISSMNLTLNPAENQESI